MRKAISVCVNSISQLLSALIKIQSYIILQSENRLYLRIHPLTACVTTALANSCHVLINRHPWRSVWLLVCHLAHYNDVIMGAIASQITSLASVYSAVWLGKDQRKHQSSASLAFVRGIHRRPVNSPHIGPVTRKMFPFDDVIRNN